MLLQGDIDVFANACARQAQGLRATPATRTDASLANVVGRLAPGACGYVVAYSGGLDSTVLLHLLRAQAFRGLRAIHIRHDLHPDAAAWAAHCAQRCQAWGVPLRTIPVHVDTDAGPGLEAAARRARYDALRAELAPGESLVTAHHAEDQAETFLLQALRGAGVRGLAGMPYRGAFGAGHLLRPLLETGRAAIHAYALAHELTWIDDPGNRDPRVDRAFLRQQLWPVLTARWPQAAATLGRAAAWAAQSAVLHREIAQEDAQRCAGNVGNSLSVCALRDLSGPRRRNLLPAWCRSLDLPPPDHRHLQRLEMDMLTARDAANPCVRWSGAEIRRYRDDLFAMSPLPAAPQGWTRPWQPPRALSLPAGCGRLLARAATGTGLAASLGPFTVTFRAGGERLRLPGRRHTTSLRNILQSAGVPPWVRERLPLIWAGGQLAAVADLCIDDRLRAAPDASGWVVVWE